MQILRNISKTVAVILVLLMAFVTLMAMQVQAQAQYTNMRDGKGVPLPAGVAPDATFNTLARIAFRPSPVGLGQPIIVNVWSEPPVHASRLYTGLSVTITKPDGTKQVIGPIETYYADTTAWFEYTPDQIGTYKLKFDQPGQYFPPGNYTSQASLILGSIVSFPTSAYYTAASSPEETLVVQQDWVLSWPVSPLPTDYWTRPVSPENREWWPIMGSYPSTGVQGGNFPPSTMIYGTTDWPANTNHYMSNYNFIPYVQAPKTAHIVWQEQGALAGLTGGKGGIETETAGGYSPTIIYQGRAYGTYSKPGTGPTTVTYWYCKDIRTGQLYWERPLASGESAPTVVSYYYTPPAVPGGGTGVPGSQARDPIQISPSLMSIGARLIKYDPFTGAVISNVTGMTGTFYNDPYVLSVQTNNTAAGTRLINWTTSTTDTNFTRRILSNISYAFSSLGTVDYEAGVAVTTQSITPPAAQVSYGLRIMAASITTGQLLWNVTTDPTDYTQGSYSGSTACADHGKFVLRLNDGHWHCWDLYSGKELWVSELSSYPWGIFGIYGVESAYGLLYYPQYDGVVAYNWTNGKVVWRYQYVPQYPYETVYNDNYAFYQATVKIADGIIFAANSEHSQSQPVTRGYKLHAINATTGVGMWNITGAMAATAVADGYLTGSDSYRGHTYVFGKGKSSTTVTAPDVVIPKGNGVVIKGTVLDVSPAQSGTPCVSKESMATQMEYLHMQHPIEGLDHNVQMIGVPVMLTAIDSSGNAVDIGTVTTSAYYGTFEMAWTPPNEGTYKIIASFAGDDSYGSSASATAVSVGPTIETPETPDIPTSDNTPILYAVIGVGVAMIIAIATVGIMLLRKH